MKYFLLVLLFCFNAKALIYVGPFSSSIVSATSTAVTPSGTTQWQQGNGNSVTLSTGNWVLTGMCVFGNGGTSPSYTDTGCGWFGANGANSGTAPMVLSSVLGINNLGSLDSTGVFYSMASLGTWKTIPQPAYLTVTPASGTVTIYLVTWSQQTTSANARTSVNINAQRLP